MLGGFKMDINTVRVLSFDGGGVRGYLSLKFLQRFVQQWGINPNELWKYWDVISGTSIGGIMALAIAFGKNLDELEPFFLSEAKRIFTIRSILTGCDADSDSNRPNTLQKIALLVLNDPFYKSACEPDAGNSNYGSNILQQALVNIFGTATMADLKTKVVIPSYEKDTGKYVMFSNYADPMFKGQNETIVNVARATSAAPAYFPEHTFNGHRYGDGGVYQNNSSSIALAEAKAIKTSAIRGCVLSLGTGIGEMGFDNPTTAGLLTSTDSAIKELFALFDIASTGGQESVDFDLRLRSKRSLEQLHYYRFQPKLDLTINTELDNSDVTFLNYMADTANIIFVNDNANITNFLGKLIA
jgi:predicted acylesterase/phospholipase RssA